MSTGSRHAGDWAEGFVYVMECQGYYKIGYAKNPRSRRSNIQGANPFPVKLVGVIEGTPADEAAWHHAFREQQVSGEWFDLSEEDVARVLHESYGIDNVYQLPDTGA